MYRQVQDPYTQLSSNKIVQRIEDNAFIPTDTGNKDYQEYLTWLAAGNSPLPAQ